MKRFYESYSEMIQKKGYIMGLSSDRNNTDGESQFLNSRPTECHLIGVIPMTGEGIEAEVDDFSFADD